MRQSRLLRALLLVVLALLCAAGAQAAPRSLYLTFDADMTPRMLRRLEAGEVKRWYDPDIVAYLREHRIPAVVFVTGLFAEAYPGFVESIAHDPLFTVGVHGYRHAAYTPHCYGLPVLKSDEEKREDVALGRDTVAKVCGRQPSLFRYPGLCHDGHDDEIVVHAGLTVDMPTVIAGDSFNRNVGAIVAQVLGQARDHGTVIFHLGGPNAPVTLDALKRVVPELEKRGYRFAAK
jgi:peptidoglycan/xylan/chitin deacetylase (PgdA/CDA1 family)